MNLIAWLIYLRESAIGRPRPKDPTSSEQEPDISTSWHRVVISSWQNLKRIIEPLALAVGVSLVCNWLGVPVAWLVGPLLAGVAYSYSQGSPKPLPSSFITIGKAIIGVSSAARFSLDALALAKTYAAPLSLCIVITGALSMFNGYLIWKWTGMNRPTSFLGSIPGSSSNIVAMSEELGADPVGVAVLQYLRMMLMVLVVPTMAGWLFPNTSVTGTASLSTAVNAHPIPMSVNLLVLVGCCSLGIVGGKWLKLPTSGFLGSFLLGLLVFWSLPYSFHVPRSLLAAGLLLVGVSTGLKFDVQVLRQLWKAAILEIVLAMLLMLCCLGIGYEFHLITRVDTMTALLGFVPGGIEAMIATVTQLGGDTGVVLSIQLTRQFLILFIINLLHLFVNSRRQVTS